MKNRKRSRKYQNIARAAAYQLLLTVGLIGRLETLPSVKDVIYKTRLLDDIERFCRLCIVKIWFEVFDIN